MLTMLNLLGQSVEMSCDAMPHRLVGKSIFSCSKPNKERCKFTDADRAEIDAGDEITAVTFIPSGEHLVIGTLAGVQVWRMKDGERVATMKVKYSVGNVVTVSKDGRFIAAVSQSNVLVWDTTTYEQVFEGHQCITKIHNWCCGLRRGNKATS